MHTSNRFRQFAALLLAGVLSATTAFAEGPSIDWDLKDALKQVDRQADDFDSAMARVEVVAKDVAGTETRREKGTLFIREDGRIRVAFDAPNTRTVLLIKNDLYIYYPEREVVEQYSLSKHKDKLIPYARLGFTTTGRDLEDDFLLSSLGERDVGTNRTLGLDLTPESKRQRELLSGVQLWIDQASWMPAQQVISAARGAGSLTITYTHTARNLDLNPDLFKASWPRGTDRKRM